MRHLGVLLIVVAGALLLSTGSAAESTDVERITTGEDFHAGVAVLLYRTDYHNEQGEPDEQVLRERANWLFKRLRGLSVNAVSINFPVVQADYQANEVVRGEQTPTYRKLRIAIRLAHKHGLAVTLRPLLDEENLAPEHWRGNIQPENPEQWFSSYTELMVSYAKLAEDTDVEVFSVGAEFTSLQGETAAWRNLIGRIRDVFSGEVTYSANWDAYREVQFWNSVDFIGIDTLFPLEPTQVPPSSSHIARSWQEHLSQIRRWASTVEKPVVSTEIGTPSQKKSYLHPWKQSAEAPLSLRDQRVYYEGSCEALHSALGGMYWLAANIWMPEHPDRGYSPLGKPAEREILQCYRR